MDLIGSRVGGVRAADSWQGMLDRVEQGRFPPFVGATAVEPDALPQPQRSLLVHERSMTATLAEFHRAPIDLDVLTMSRGEGMLTRIVRLRRRSDAAPVELGAIVIDLDRLPGDLRVDVERGQRPFGRLLAEFDFGFLCRPFGFYALRADRVLALGLGATPGEMLWGRCNRLYARSGQLVAQVAELLPTTRAPLD